MMTAGLILAYLSAKFYLC